MGLLKRRLDELTAQGEKLHPFLLGQSRIRDEKLFIAREPLVPVGRGESFSYVAPPALRVVLCEIDVRLQHHLDVVIPLGVSNDCPQLSLRCGDEGVEPWPLFGMLRLVERKYLCRIVQPLILGHYYGYPIRSYTCCI